MKHFFQGIPGWFAWAIFYARQVQEAKDGAHFVEVGAWLGRSTAYLAVEIINSGKDIKLDVVDSWPSGYENYPVGLIDDWTRENGPAKAQFEKNLERVKDHFTLHHMPSVEAAKLYADRSLDFVFIDADHSYEAVKADIAAWTPKVKRGGTIAGDDFNEPDVERAVKESYSSFEAAYEAQMYWVKGL